VRFNLTSSHSKKVSNMDPNEALFYARQSAERILACVDDSEPIDDFDAIRLAESLQALDQWIAKGGFLPKRWNKE